MTRNLVRVAQVPVGATFKYFGALYIKTRNLLSGGNNGRDYGNNAQRLDNGKEVRIQGSYLVEVVNNGN